MASTVVRMDTPSYQARVARNVSDAIQAAGLTQLAVSEETKIPRTTLLRRLAGAQPFTANELKAIADVTGTPITSLIAVEDGAA